MHELEFEELVRETDKAYLIQFEEGVEIWMPKSQVDISSDGYVTCPEWLVIENELEIYIYE